MDQYRLKKYISENPDAKLRDLVTKLLYDDIVELRITPGSKLNVNQIAASLGISRTPVAEAIGKLAEVVSGTTPAYKNGITSAIVSYDETGHVTKVVVKQSGRTCTYDASKGTYEVGDTAPVAGGSGSDT